MIAATSIFFFYLSFLLLFYHNGLKFWSRLVQTCQNLSRLVFKFEQKSWCWFSQDLSKLVQTCPNLFKHVQTCSNMSKLVQTCQNLYKTAKEWYSSDLKLCWLIVHLRHFSFGHRYFNKSLASGVNLALQGTLGTAKFVFIVQTYQILSMCNRCNSTLQSFHKSFLLIVPF